MADKKYSAVTLTRVFTYLDNLRESGVTNMFGAAPYIVQAFGFGKDDARAELAAKDEVVEAAVKYRAARGTEPCNWTTVELTYNTLVAALNRAQGQS